MTDARIAQVRRCSVDVTWRTTWDFVEIRTADGASGIGEWSDAGPWQLSRRAFDVAATDLVGLSVDDALERVAEAWRDLARQPPSAQRRMQLTILGAFDGALCDLAARCDGLTLPAWLGGGSESSRCVTSYANINRAIMSRTPDQFARVAEAAAAAGFTAIKCAPFDFLVGARQHWWLWWAGPAGSFNAATIAHACLYRFSIEHGFKFAKGLGWTNYKPINPATAANWTWLILAAMCDFILARDLATDYQLPWDQPAPPTPARVHRVFRRTWARLPRLASAPKYPVKSP